MATSTMGVPTTSRRSIPAPPGQAAGAAWRSLYLVGGAAALLMVALIPIQAFIYIVWPPPSTAIDYFALFQRNWLLGLVSLDLLYLVDNALMIPIYLALYMALRRANESLMAITLATGFVAIAAYFGSNTAFEMLSLSQGYATATTEAQRTVYLAAGQGMLATYAGTAFDVYYVLSAIALLIISGVMLRSGVFGNAIAYLGLLAGGLMVVPSTAGALGLYFSLASLAPWALWLLLFARRLFQLRQESMPEGQTAAAP